MKSYLHRRGLSVLLSLMLLTGVLAATEQGTGRASTAASPDVLLVGSWQGHPGQFSTISSAVATAKPGDWILVGPGDYRENPGHQLQGWSTSGDAQGPIHRDVYCVEPFGPADCRPSPPC